MVNGIDRFQSSCDFDDIVKASGVEMDIKGQYFAKEYRNCMSVAMFVTAVKMALSAKDREILRLNGEIARKSDEMSKESAKVATTVAKLEKVTRTAVMRGLEQTELPPATRDRLLNVS